MGRRKEVVCDACGEVIKRAGWHAGRGWWATFKLGWVSGVRMKLRKWGIIDYSPVTDGWQRRRVDLCDTCWPAVLAAVQAHVSTDE